MNTWLINDELAPEKDVTKYNDNHEIVKITIFSQNEKTGLVPVFSFCVRSGIRTRAEVNGLPGAAQSREVACAAAQVESLRLHHVVASFISLATTFLCFASKSSRAHSAAPPFRIEPAAAGLRFGGEREFVLALLLSTKYKWLSP